jgi:hypothetical protein
LRILRTLENGADIARLGDVGEVELGLQLVGIASWPSLLPTATTLILEVSTHTHSFILFDGTGVRFLFGNADLGKYVKDCLALYF